MHTQLISGHGAEALQAYVKAVSLRREALAQRAAAAARAARHAWRQAARAAAEAGEEPPQEPAAANTSIQVVPLLSVHLVWDLALCAACRLPADICPISVPARPRQQKLPCSRRSSPRTSCYSLGKAVRAPHSRSCAACEPVSVRVQGEPLPAKLLNNMAVLTVRAGNPSAALALLEEAFQVDPDSESSASWGCRAPGMPPPCIPVLGNACLHVCSMR